MLNILFLCSAPRSRLSPTCAVARLGAGLYVGLPSFSAQALATAEFGFSVPGNVAQPPFSMSVCRSQDGALLNATSFAAIGLLLEPLDADRSQRRYDRGFGALAGHFLRGAAECPSERRKPDNRERNSADHCTPYRWFHPGMDLHFVTLALGEFLLVQIKRGNIARGKPATVGSETTQTTPPGSIVGDRRQCLLTGRRGLRAPAYQARHVSGLRARQLALPDCRERAFVNRPGVPAFLFLHGIYRY